MFHSGLGEVISISFAKEGANVAVNYFNRVEPAQNVVKACEKHGVKAVALKGVCTNRSFIRLGVFAKHRGRK
jgi:NAD(P)-dependent dehydrogenase (short-subunit alcohol dehydrogenase family)